MDRTSLVSLADMQKAGKDLTQDQVDSLYDLLKGRSHKRTKEKLYRRLMDPLHTWKGFRYLARILVNDQGEAIYVASQDRTFEIANIREVIISQA